MTPVLIAALVLPGFFALFVYGVRALDRAERKVDQILRDELDDPDPFNQRLIPKNHKPTDTGETR